MIRPHVKHRSKGSDQRSKFVDNIPALPTFVACCDRHFKQETDRIIGP